MCQTHLTRVVNLRGQGCTSTLLADHVSKPVTCLHYYCRAASLQSLPGFDNGGLASKHVLLAEAPSGNSVLISHRAIAHSMQLQAVVRRSHVQPYLVLFLQHKFCTEGLSMPTFSSILPVSAVCPAVPPGVIKTQLETSWHA